MFLIGKYVMPLTFKRSPQPASVHLSPQGNIWWTSLADILLKLLKWVSRSQEMIEKVKLGFFLHATQRKWEWTGQAKTVLLETFACKFHLDQNLPFIVRKISVSE